VARAKALVPAATFVQGDMTEIWFPPGSFAAVVCLYALIHVPVAEHREMLRRISLWLRPEGALLTTVGEHATAGTERDWLGVEGATM
jgi:2-polyprenyl-3-methyl-5-hydroxy-6-metoxy-1,4-benzoquinol methylase